MSTDYCLLKKVPACDLFDGRLEGFGVREHVKPDATTEKSRLLTDGRNYLWVYIGDDGFVGCLTRYYPNGAPGKILSVLAEVFDTDIVSEYEPRFWGFDSQEEWDADTDQRARESRDRFYLEIINYLRGERNTDEIRHGTVGERQAQIAQKLVERDPSLLQPEAKEKLMAQIDAAYMGDHAATVELSDEEIVAARMMVTHEKDLPQA